MRKLLLALLAVALLVPPAASTASAHTGSGCAIWATDNRHIAVAKYAPDFSSSTTHFVKITAEVRPVRALESCSGLTYVGFNAVLPVNVETAGPDGEIVQLGYARWADQTGLKFVYADGSPLALEWPYNYTPIVGHSYRFTIEKTSIGLRKYTIVDIYGGTSSTYYSPNAWRSDFNYAWWGFETQDGDVHRIPHGSTNGSGTAITKMGYVPNNVNSVYWRTGLRSVYYSDPLIAARQNAILKPWMAEADSECHQGFIGTTTYSSDTLYGKTLSDCP